MDLWTNDPFVRLIDDDSQYVAESSVTNEPQAQPGKKETSK